MTRLIRNCARVIVICCAIIRCVAAAPVQQEHVAAASKGGGGSPPQDKAYVKMTIPDAEVLDQDGKKLRFYTDLIKGKVVVINFIFTTCAYICPMQGSSFSKLQAELGERSGEDIHLISVSTDPLTDTPDTLKAWGERFGVKRGWTLVTGEKKHMDNLLRALTGDTARTGEHSPIAIIGSDEKRVWIRAYGLESPKRMIEIIRNLPNPGKNEAARR
jgi:protein SCO1/2